MLNKHKNFYSVLLIFILPMLISWGLYYFHDHFHFKTLNHGTIINPPLKVIDLYSDLQNGTNKVWRIIQVENEFCDQTCEKTHYQLTQLQKALGKDGKRTQVILITDATRLTKLNFSFDQKFKNFVVINKIYLVDPLGNLFMYYPDSTNPMNILKDLKKVLGVSQIG